MMISNPPMIFFIFMYIAIIGIEALIGTWIGSYKGREGLGAILGALFGFVGWIIIACIPETPEKRAERLTETQRIMNHD